uniref:Uncharacterized protein n=1 Tax=Rhizophagus irregularis (strain DAOM 181602 / DAOM 197198 / MUCL 43194) TaxID=747089 RepID=U9U7G3_RHIID
MVSCSLCITNQAVNPLRRYDYVTGGMIADKNRCALITGDSKKILQGFKYGY